MATKDRSVHFLDSKIPPERRAELSDNLKEWTSQNPRLAGFVFSHLLLSAPPILVFLGFVLAALCTSVFVCLLTALTVVLSFTAFCAGLALLILLPILLVSTVSATFIFVAGFIFYAIVQRFSNDPRTEGSRTRARETALSLKDGANEALDSRVESVIPINPGPAVNSYYWRQKFDNLTSQNRRPDAHLRSASSSKYQHAYSRDSPAGISRGTTASAGGGDRFDAGGKKQEWHDYWNPQAAQVGATNSQIDNAGLQSQPRRNDSTGAREIRRSGNFRSSLIGAGPVNGGVGRLSASWNDTELPTTDVDVMKQIKPEHHAVPRKPQFVEGL